MCDAKYHLYWWAVEPYSEPEEEAGEKEEASNAEIIKPTSVKVSENGVEGLIMNILHQLFSV